MEKAEQSRPLMREHSSTSSDSIEMSPMDTEDLLRKPTLSERVRRYMDHRSCLSPQVYLPLHTDSVTSFSKILAARKLLWSFLAVIVIGLTVGITTTTTSSSTRSYAQSTTHAIASHLSWGPFKDRYCAPLTEGTHTVACHVRRARTRFEAMQKSQSKTYEQAVQRYVKQYNRQPPPGFRDWFEFAKAHNSTIIDEYGQLEKDLEPLRHVPANILRERVRRAASTGDKSLFTYKFANGNVTASVNETGGLPGVTLQIFRPFASKIMPFEILGNWDDSHRVCGPGIGKDNLSPEVGMDWFGGLPNSLPHLARNCERYGGTESILSSDRPSVDICKHGEDYKNKHGLFRMWNGCFNTTIPVLSLTRVSQFQDITTASWCYYDKGYRLRGDDVDNIPYKDKKPTVYWRGSSTGGRSDLDVFAFGHRPRFVMFNEQMKAKTIDLQEGRVTPRRKPLWDMPTYFSSPQMKALARLKPETFDVGFTYIFNCEDKKSFCSTWKEKIGLKERAPATNAMKHRFLVDMDGNSMSCRYYRLLDSNSLVFKQTVYVEWHDDRLVPWLHYVPLSLGMEELPILLDFFTNDPEGIQYGEEIAMAGRRWAETSLRQIDLSIYAYRQILELSNILGEK